MKLGLRLELDEKEKELRKKRYEEYDASALIYKYDYLHRTPSALYYFLKNLWIITQKFGCDIVSVEIISTQPIDTPTINTLNSINN